MAYTIQGTEVASSKRYSQVYTATHVGENTLPYMRRSFISFTFGGKKIEDFDLIATISGDRMNRSAYAPFEDTVTSYDRLDGQYYWATHYQANQLDFVLSTDGIDQRQLDEFLHWFRAGDMKELILAEHPNRAIMARVAEPPEINLLPFETDVDMVISGITYSVKTTLFKGDINLSFVMDQPHWYSIVNILGKTIVEGNKTRYVDIWKDITTGQEISLFASQDALKILYEDGIPLGSMIDSNMLLGNGAYANVENNDTSITWTKYESDGNFLSGSGARIDGTVTGSGGKYEAGTYVGVIAGAIVDASNNGITTLSSGQSGYFFYSGTAPAPTIVSFTLTPVMNGEKLISVPKNSYTNNSTPYNTLVFESLHSQTLRFTTPNLFTSYNKAQSIFAKMLESTRYSWEDIRAKIRDEVRHQQVRKWAIKCIEYCVKTHSGASLETLAPASDLSTIQTAMSYLITDSSGSPYTATFTFNSETGEAIGEFRYRNIPSSVTSSTNWSSTGTNSTKRVENVGDMLQSNYLIITDRNYPHDGRISHWESTTDKTKQYSHRIVHDVSSGLSNIQVLYKNMYL